MSNVHPSIFSRYNWDQEIVLGMSEYYKHTCIQQHSPPPPTKYSTEGNQESPSDIQKLYIHLIKLDENDVFWGFNPLLKIILNIFLQEHWTSVSPDMLLSRWVFPSWFSCTGPPKNWQLRPLRESRPLPRLTSVYPRLQRKEKSNS